MKTTKRSPVWENFKAAGQLVNEWRDTLLVIGVAGLAVANGCMDIPYLTSHELVCALSAVAYAREGVRTFSWFGTKEMKVAGDSFYQQRPLGQCQQASLAVFGGVVAGLCLFCAPFMTGKLFPKVLPYVKPLFLGWGAWNLFGAGLMTKRMGGPKELVGTYGYIWDWPRKRDGGNSQTQKFMKGRRAFAAKWGRSVSQPV